MEIPILQLQFHISQPIILNNFTKINNKIIPTTTTEINKMNHLNTTMNLTYFGGDNITTNTLITTNDTWSGFNNFTNISSDYDYDFQTINASLENHGNIGSSPSPTSPSLSSSSSPSPLSSSSSSSSLPSTSTSWALCKEWTPAQHPLFQTANFFLAAAFLVPSSFKQSVLIVRALLSIGYFFVMIWGGIEVCAPDIFLWNLLLIILNFIHTIFLGWRFSPATLTLELTELYDKIFKPLKVSRKHFKELIKEAKMMTLETGDIYAVEDVSPADERLSILLKGKMRVTCDDTHLHFINIHQFVDSPEWESNHEQSDDVFQVTITAEEDCVYLCWPRMKLERILRHRPMLKVVMDAIIGKDITQKLYALNEHLSGLDSQRKRDHRDEMWAKTHNRSMSMDAVNTGTTGLVRSQAYKNLQQRKNSLTIMGSWNKLQAQCWVPLTAKQFPEHSPFNPPSLPQPLNILKLPEVHNNSLKKTRSFKRSREVKFENPKNI